jgi:hypothetical protein
VVFDAQTHTVAIELLTRQVSRRAGTEARTPAPGFRALPRPTGNRGRKREEGRFAADRGTARFHIPRRVFLSLDYAAQESIGKWQSAKNSPFRTDLSLIHSRFGISFQFLRASVQAPLKNSPLSPWERAGPTLFASVPRAERLLNSQWKSHSLKCDAAVRSPAFRRQPRAAGRRRAPIDLPPFATGATQVAER